MAQNSNHLNAIKAQLQKVIFDQHHLLTQLEEKEQIPKYDPSKEVVLHSKNVPEKKQILNNENAKLENLEVVFAVIGTMKAGKSSTINALVGREVLPKRNTAMTSLPTLIAHKTGQTEAVLSFPAQEINNYIDKIKCLNLEQYKTTQKHEGKTVETDDEIIKIIEAIKDKNYKFVDKYEGDIEIYDFLVHLNDLVRLATHINIQDESTPKFPYNAYTDVNALPRIEVEFSTLKHIDTNSSIGRLVLLDTPGPNEANIPELQTIVEKQLARCSALMLIFNYTQLKTLADQDLRTTIFNILGSSKKPFFALVNHYDAKDDKSDNEEQTKKRVNNLLDGKIKNSNIFCISALHALLAKAFQDQVDITGQKPELDENNIIKEFSAKLCGGSSMWGFLNIEQLTQISREKLEQSNIQSVLNEIITKNFKNAPTLALSSAFIEAERVFTDIENALSIKSAFAQEIEMTDKEIKGIEATLKNIEDQLGTLSMVKDEVQSDLKKLEEDVKSQTDKFVERLSAQTNRICKDSITGILNKTKTSSNAKYEEKRWWKLDNEYYKKSEYKQRQEDAQNSQNNQTIKFTESEYNEVCEDLYGILEAAPDFVKAEVKNTIEPIKENIAQKSKQTDLKLQNSISKIQAQFAERNIIISVPTFSLPEFFMPELNITEESILKGITNTKDETCIVESTAIFSDVKRWFGGKFGKDDWGYEEKTFTYKIVKQAEFRKRFVELFEQQITTPIIQPIQTATQQFASQNQAQLNQLTQTLEQLKNELETNLQLEQDQPIEEKKARKAILKAIFDANQAITNSMQVLRPLIEKTEEIA